MRCTVTMVGAVMTIAVGASPAAAWDRFEELEIAATAALQDRSATGTDDALLGYGYDAQSGLAVGADVRLYYSLNRYFAVGPMVGASHQAGPLLGAVDGHAFRLTTMDAGLAARTLFPCMSSDDLRVHLSGILAVTGVHADAGEGVGGRENGPLIDERRAASDALDHAGVGWRLALDLSAHVGSFIVGGGLGIRQYFGVDAPISRGWAMDVGLRVGGRIDLPGAGGTDAVGI